MEGVGVVGVTPRLGQLNVLTGRARIMGRLVSDCVVNSRRVGGTGSRLGSSGVRRVVARGCKSFCSFLSSLFNSVSVRIDRFLLGCSS